MSAPSMTEEKIYTVKQVADILQVDPRTVRKMITDGELEAFKVRDEYRIRQSILEGLMKRREKQE